MKLLEVNATKEFASTYLNDIFFKMAVNRVLDAAPGIDLVRCKECKWYQIRKWDDGKPIYDCRKTHALLDVKPDDFCSYGERKGND